MENEKISQLEKFKNMDESYSVDMVEGFVGYMDNIINMFGSDNFYKEHFTEEELKRIFCDMTDKVIEMSKEEKERLLIEDVSFKELVEKSKMIEKIAQEIYLNGKSDISIDLDESLNQMESLLENVKDFNKQEAIKDLSESSEDVEFIKNPQTPGLSFRLHDFIQLNLRE